MDFAVFDIETDSKGNMLDIGFLFCDQFFTFQNWNDFYEFIKKEKIKIYGHNAGNFDSVSFAIWLFKNNINFKVSLQQSRIINLQFGKVSIRDSFCLLQSSLDNLAKTFGIDSKIKHDFISNMENLKKENSNLYYDYLKRDCEILFEVLQRFDFELKNIYEKSELKLTIGSTALNIYRKKFQTRKIFFPSKIEKDVTRKSVRGGRVEIYKTGKFDNVNIYDVNSLYPAMMLKFKYPIRSSVRVSELIFENGIVGTGIYKVEFKQLKNRLPILINEEKQYCFSGIAWTTHHELNYLLNECGGVITKVLEGYYYPYCDYIFSDFVETFYNLRKNTDDQARKNIYKYLLNNLFGKFLQRDEIEVMKVLSLSKAREMLNDGKEIMPYLEDSEKGLYIYKEENRFSKSNVSFPAIGSMVTAAGRVYLTSVLERYFENAIYCDTDSIHLHNIVLDESYLSSDEIGKFKTEYENVTGYYFGKKQYSIIKNGKILTKQKGIPLKFIPSDYIDKMYKGESVEIEYYSPTKFKTAIRDEIENPNQFLKRIRTVAPQNPIKYSNPFC